MKVLILMLVYEKLCIELHYHLFFTLVIKHFASLQEITHRSVRLLKIK